MYEKGKNQDETKNRMLSICALTCMLPVTVQAAETAPAADESSNMVQTEDVNVTAQGYEKPTLDTPADATVYTADELKKTGAHDVISALKYKNGVHFTQMGPRQSELDHGKRGRQPARHRKRDARAHRRDSRVF